MRFGTIIWLLAIPAIAVGLYSAALVPLQNWRDRVTAEYTTTLGTHQRLTQSIARMTVEVVGFAEDPALPMTWQAPQIGQATAQVQGELSQLTRAAGISLMSTTPVGARDIPFADSVAFRLEGEGSLDQWRDMLIAVEYNTPPIIVERGVMRRLVRPGPETEQPTLYVQLDLLAPVQLVEQ